MEEEFYTRAQLKAALLCQGIKTTETSQFIYNLEHNSDVVRTGNTGLQLDLGYGINCIAPYNNKHANNSPWTLYSTQDKRYFLTDSVTTNVEVFPMIQEIPKWYNHKLSNGKYVTDYVQLEGDNVLICSISRTCCYFSKNEACRFCCLNNGCAEETEQEYFESVCEAFEHILLNTPQSNQINGKKLTINLTGGNQYTKNKGAERYIKLVQRIREINPEVPIAIEMSPPEDLSLLQLFKNIGVTAIEMNVEFWNDDARKELMPGKSKIPKEYYMDVLTKSVQLFGRGNVGSAIIIGLEDVASSLDGIKALINIGVIPSVIPFKPTAGSFLENADGCNADLIFEVTDYAAKLLAEVNLDPDFGCGCISCMACHLEGDIYKYYKLLQEKIHILEQKEKLN